MKRWDIQQNAMLVCPKPRRLGYLAGQAIVPFRWSKSSMPGEQLDSNAGAELLNLILTKETYDVDQREIAPSSSSSPFFCVSPPTRVSNPLVQDTNFRNEKSSPVSTRSSPRKSGCGSMKVGLKPAAVRVEGFNCLSKDHHKSGITAVA